MGEMADANPIPKPPNKRKATNKEKSLTDPVPMADMVNNTEANNNKPLLPYRSANKPEETAPTRQPIRALLMAQPCEYGEVVMSKKRS